MATHLVGRNAARLAQPLHPGRRRGFLCRSNTKDSIIIYKTRLPSIVEILLVSGIGGRCGHRFDTYLVCCC